MKGINEVKNLLSTSKKIVITSHVRPDGDAMGSSLGLYHYLLNLGHQVEVIVPTEYAQFLHFLPANNMVKIFQLHADLCRPLIEGAEIIFTLDYNALSRVKDMGVSIAKSKATKIMIDHHPEPEDYADFQLLDTTASSACELVHRFIKQLNPDAKFSPETASCLYTGLSSDTGRFKYNFKYQVHDIASELIQSGADYSLINNQLFDSFTERRLRLLGYSLSKRMRLFPEYRAAYIFLNRDDFRRFNVQAGDTEGLVNYPLSLEHIDFVALIKEDESIIKLSFRSKGSFPANAVAKKYFNGGGHLNAAGGASKKGLNEVLQKFESILPEYKDLLLNKK